MKRLLVTALIAAVLVCSPLKAEAAETSIDLYLPDAGCEVGERFSVMVSIAGNPGFAAMQMTLLYDSDVLHCTEVKTGKMLKQLLTSVNTLTGEERPGASVTAVGLDPAEGDGILAEFNFTVLAEGETGLELSDIEIADIDDTEISYTLKRHAYKDASTENENNAGITPGITAQPNEQISTPFSDVPIDHWASGYIVRAVEYGLVDGYEDGSFRPDEPITRGQFVSILWRMVGSPELGKASGFDDVAAEAWYAKAVTWAAENGYVSGIGDGRFDPLGYITREQITAVLFRYNGRKSGMEAFFADEYDTRYADSGDISDWAKNGMYWAVYNGIVSGVTDSALAPKSTASRAQVVTILLRYKDMTRITV